MLTGINYSFTNFGDRNYLILSGTVLGIDFDSNLLRWKERREEERKKGQRRNSQYVLL